MYNVHVHRHDVQYFARLDLMKTFPITRALHVQCIDGMDVRPYGLLVFVDKNDNVLGVFVRNTKNKYP
jgi:hypothetical protein